MSDEKRKEKAPNPLFEALNALQTKQYRWGELPEEVRNKYSQFMINRFISSYDYLLPMADQLSTQKLDNETHYNILLEYIKHCKHYFKYDYFKASKKTDQDVLRSVMKQYDIGKKEAERYCELLTEPQKAAIVDKWKDYFAMTSGT